jgi:hypothetical protein
LSLDIPFRLSSSADDADADARLMVSSVSRRLNGHVALAADGLVFAIEASGAEVENTAEVKYAEIASAVLRPGILTSRIRLTARNATSFVELSPRNPREVTLLVSRKFRHEARAFVSALQIRLADTQQSRLRTPPPGPPAQGKS